MSTLISELSTLTGSVNNNTDVFPVLDQTISSAANKNKKARITANNLFYSNNFTISGLSSYGNYFGTGKDGSVTISGSAQVSASLNNISREYGDTIVKNYQDLTIDSGILFSPLRACRGMVIYCTGNLTVNGTISMTSKGGGVATKIAAPIGIASSTDSRYDLVDATLYFNNLSSSASGGRGIPTHWNWATSGSAWFSNFKVRVPLSGSVAGGAAGAWQGNGAAGTAGIFCCGSGGGGGGGGYYSQPATGGAGGRGTIFTGGSGGGGGGWAYATGGTGTYEVSAPAAGSGGTGAGGVGGNLSGVGGLLILIVRGNITINGTLSSNGANGSNGSAPSPDNHYQSGGGGGSGGGRIMIIYGGTYNNTGTIVVNGGSGAVGNLGNYAGGAGGAGSTTVKKVHV